MKYRLQDLIDVEQFQSLQDRLNEIYSFPSAIIDNEGNVLTATAWQDICTQFHRKNEECLKECIKSDQYILSHLHEADPAVSYCCPHGLIDNATPIVIEGVHYGNYFTGQFFLEEPNLEFFKEQAQKYGFDEAAYLEAVRKVPIWTREQLNSYLFFIKGLIEVISAIGLKNLKEAETRKQLEESEKKFRTLHNMAPIAIVLNRLDNGQYLESNQALRDMTGYSEEEFRSLTFWDITPIEYAEMEARRLESLRTVGRYGPYEKEYIRKDGRHIPVLLTGVLIKDPQGTELIYSVIQDITELRRMQEAQREAEERYRRLVDSAFDGYIIHSDGLIRTANPSYAAMYGYTTEELIDKPVLELSPPEHKEKVASIIQAGQTTPYESIGLRKDGTRFHIETAGQSCTFQGKPARIAAVRDITERKQTEEKIRQALAEKEVLLKEVHHRVKNNLQIVSSLLQLQAKNVADPRVQDAMRESQNRIKSMALVHEKLYQSSDLAHLDFRAYVQSLAANLFRAHLAKGRVVRFHLTMPDMTLSLNTAIPCGLLLNELLTNALKHAFREDRPSPENEISICCEEAGEAWRLTFADNGMGLSDDVDWSRPGTLGLRLVHMLATQLNGTIRLEPGPGCRFVLEFPKSLGNSKAGE